jgi:hypothetical protein
MAVGTQKHPRQRPIATVGPSLSTWRIKAGFCMYICSAQGPHKMLDAQNDISTTGNPSQNEGFYSLIPQQCLIP